MNDIPKPSTGDDGKLNMTIKLRVTEAQALALQAMFEYMTYLGGVGASRYVAFMADGDGNFQPKADCTFDQPVRPLTDELREKAVVKDEHGHRKYDFDGIAWALRDNEE